MDDGNERGRGECKVTIDEIVNSTAPMLSAYDVAEILGSDPSTIRLMVQQDPDALKPLGPIRTGNRVKFPRLRFIGWYYGDAMPMQADGLANSQNN